MKEIKQAEENINKLINELSKPINYLDQIFVWKTSTIKLAYKELLKCSCCGDFKEDNRSLCRDCIKHKKDNYYNLGLQEMKKQKDAEWIKKIDKLILFYSNPVDAVKRDALEELKGEKRE